MSGKHAHSHGPIKSAKHEWHEKPTSVMPLNIQIALKDAMRTENVPATDSNDLLWIMAQESAGVAW